MSSLETLSSLQHILISITLGLFVGLQRQWAVSPLGGVRTFSLISFAGTLAALLSDKYGVWPFVTGIVGIITFTVIGNVFHFTEEVRQKKQGLTTEVAMLLMFLIGALVISHPLWIAVTSAGALAIILQAKMELHDFATRLTGKELKSIMQFVLLTVIILPLVPNKTIDPLDVVNPYHVWLMIILIVGLGLAGYIVYKFFGRHAGILLSGILGGLISSTATTVNYAKSSQSDSMAGSGATIIIISWTMIYLRLVVEVFVTAPSFNSVYLPLAIMFLVSVLCSFWLWRNSNNHLSEMPVQENPSEIKVAVYFGIIYSVITFGVAYARQFWNDEALYSIAFISGITDMDAITLSTSNLVKNGKLGEEQGWKLIVIAACANTLFKGFIVGAFGNRVLFKMMLLPLVLTVSTGVALLFIL